LRTLRSEVPEPRRQGSGLWNLVPYQAFKAADGWVLIGVTNDAAWLRFCSAAGLDDLAENTAYATPKGRIANRQAIVDRIHETIHCALP
jgi:crotonobetainyl-CoA:carnitine CoA-transferase CaiB-like acyl-CoA transferase